MKGRTRVFRGRDSIRSTNLSHRVVPLRTAIRRVICIVPRWKKKYIYIYIFLLVHIAIKRKKNFASTAGTTGKSSRDFPFHCRIEGPSTELVKLGELLTREEGKSVERTIEEIYITSLCCILIPVVVVASFRQCHLWTVLNSTPWPKFQWRAQSCRPRGNGNRDTE